MRVSGTPLGGFYGVSLGCSLNKKLIHYMTLQFIGEIRDTLTRYKTIEDTLQWCALGFLGWLVCPHASVIFGSFSIICLDTCCVIRCLLWLWLLFVSIACVIGVAVLCLIHSAFLSFLPQLVCVWRVLGSLFTMKANPSLGPCFEPSSIHNQVSNVLPN